MLFYVETIVVACCIVKLIHVGGWVKIEVEWTFDWWGLAALESLALWSRMFHITNSIDQHCWAGLKLEIDLSMLSLCTILLYYSK